MKKLNRAAATTLGLGLLGGLILSVGCSSTPSPDGGGSGGAGVGGTGVGGTGVGGTGVGGTGVGGTGVGGTGVGGTGVGGTGTGGSTGTGGEIGVGGGATTEGDPIPKPALITSANGNFWDDTVTPTAGGTTATVTVDPAAELQTWVGWGGTFNEVGWNELTGLDAAERDAIMKLLFSKVDGLGLTWGRIPIGASDYALERYTLCDATATADQPVACDATNVDTAFSIEHDKNEEHGLIPFIKASQAVVAAEKAVYKGIADTTFWASPWTPPPWMKDNGEYDKGVMKNEPAILDAYALYFTKWIQAYEAEGIPIDHVHAQNEPGWAQGYPSCAWGPSKDGNNPTDIRPAFLGTFVETKLAPALSTAGLSTKVWYGTFSNGSKATDSPGPEVFPPYWDNLTAAGRQLIGGVGLQWAAFDRVSDVLAAVPGKIVMQTEHQCGNYPWVTASTDVTQADADTFFAAYAPNNYAYAKESWGLLKKWITAGVNGYSAWNMVLDHDGFNLDLARPWPQNALISFNDNGSTNVTPYYYVFRHLSQYADAGGKRIQTTGGDALAFKNPDGSIVTVIYNSGAAMDMTVSVGGNMVTFPMPADGWATLNTPAPATP